MEELLPDPSFLATSNIPWVIVENRRNLNSELICFSRGSDVFFFFLTFVNLDAIFSYVSHNFVCA